MADPIPEPTAKESQHESYGRYYSPVVGSPLDQLDTQQKTTLLSHISRAEITYGLGSFIIEFQLLETLIAEHKGHVLTYNIVTGRLGFLARLLSAANRIAKGGQPWPSHTPLSSIRNRGSFCP